MNASFKTRLERLERSNLITISLSSDNLEEFRSKLHKAQPRKMRAMVRALDDDSLDLCIRQQLADIGFDDLPEVFSVGFIEARLEDVHGAMT